jgi:hypothetical protein
MFYWRIFVWLIRTLGSELALALMSRIHAFVNRARVGVGRSATIAAGQIPSIYQKPAVLTRGNAESEDHS